MDQTEVNLKGNLERGRDTFIHNSSGPFQKEPIQSTHIIDAKTGGDLGKTFGGEPFKTFRTDGKGGVKDLIALFPPRVQPLREGSEDVCIRVLKSGGEDSSHSRPTWSTEILKDEDDSNYRISVIQLEPNAFYIQLDCWIDQPRLRNSFNKIGLKLRYKGDYLVINSLHLGGKLKVKPTKFSEGGDTIQSEELKEFVRTYSLISDCDLCYITRFSDSEPPIISFYFHVS